MTHLIETNIKPFAIAKSAVVGKVLALVGFAFLFTAVGGVLGIRVGAAPWPLYLAVGLGLLFVLKGVKEHAPYNLLGLYAFATVQGLLLGPVIGSYVSRGLADTVLAAATATAVIALVAGTYGATTHRDLSGMGNVLLLALLGIILASVAGAVFQLHALQILVSLTAAVLFTIYIAYDLNQAAKVKAVTEGMIIFLAVDVYLDLLNLFVSLLQIFGEGDD